MVEPFKRTAPAYPKYWWEGDLQDLTDDEICCRALGDLRGRPGDGVSEGGAFILKAKELGVNVGGLYRASYAARAAQGGWAEPFDECTWPQALEYAAKALPWSTEAERYAWAIRYMWCLELPEPRDTLDPHDDGQSSE